MAKYIVTLSNNKTQTVNNVDEITVNNETFFLQSRDASMRLTTEFSIPTKHVFYISKAE